MNTCVTGGAWRSLFLSQMLIALLIALMVSTGVSAAQSAQPLKVFVSILPQKYFVERIGGENVDVSVLVGPGQSPTTYEPLPKQMAALAETTLYFRIGVPFESAWIDRIQGLNPKLKIVDTREGISLRAIDRTRVAEPSTRKDEVLDPHIWLDPLLVKMQAETIYNELAGLDPENGELYKNNLEGFQLELDQLHWELGETLGGLLSKKVMVFHPAWGYLFDRYGLEQLPIEHEGKEPGPKALAELTELAQKEGIQVIFLEAQKPTETALAVANAVGAELVVLDPLAEDYFANLRLIADTIQKEL